ncbi:hypothetical protein [Spelaeicoccus albus]|uniref:hypothetical protein n=1 Tax=Spelaeicoccus albus TaxID=1280376 RepID=UPI001F1C0028|nr:hypothetical protein [Spelaeicoccus albus]
MNATVHSEPFKLTPQTADADGNVQFAFKVLKGADLGQHYVSVVGADSGEVLPPNRDTKFRVIDGGTAGGDSEAATSAGSNAGTTAGSDSSTVSVSTAAAQATDPGTASSGSPLPRTGLDLLPAGIGLLLLVIGGAALVAARRRKHLKSE